MKRQILAAASLVTLGLVAGCGGSSPATTATPTSVSGKVADGYLVNATVFLDKNKNYQLDPGEPSTMTDQTGSYTLDIAPEDVGKYPIVAMAIKDQTTDMDNPGQKVANTYVLSLPAQSVSGTASSFVSPMSTLIREKMEANPGMSLTDAMAQLRSQMGLPAGTNMMADYVSLSSAGSSDPNKSNYQLMHTTAQNMASLMGGQSALVTGTSGGTTTVDVNRFRTMMGSLNDQLPQMVTAMSGGTQQGQTMMNQIVTNVGTQVSSVAPTVAGMPFRNMSTLFPPMSGTTFRNTTGNPIQSMMGGTTVPVTGGMMGK